MPLEYFFLKFSVVLSLLLVICTSYKNVCFIISDYDDIQLVVGCIFDEYSGQYLTSSTVDYICFKFNTYNIIKIPICHLNKINSAV